jgi:hypothetical protein
MQSPAQSAEKAQFHKDPWIVSFEKSWRSRQYADDY